MFVAAWALGADPLLLGGEAETYPAGPIAATPSEQADSDQPIHGSRIRPHIDFLTSPRMRGRGGTERLLAAKYVRDHLDESGLEPLFADGEYFQSIPGVGAGKPSDRPVIGLNVGAWLPGRDPQLRNEYIIISAHYDHLGQRGGEVYPGADDNASGVAMLLETARAMAQLPVRPRRSVVFVAFDLEEELLWGSRWFAAHPPWDLERVKLFVTADMIGRSLGDLPLPTVFVMGSEHATQLQTALNETRVPVGIEIARLGIDLIGTRSDYGPFRDRKIPFLFFSTGQHVDYHTPNDTPDRLDSEKIARVSCVILSLALKIAETDDPPVWRDSVAPDLAEAQTIHRITGLVLEADQSGSRTISSAQRFFVSQVHAKTGNALRLGRLSAVERKWLARSAQLLLLSVF